MASSPVVTHQPPPQSPGVPVIKHTLDYRQKVFNSDDISVLRRWRTALSHRYINLLQKCNAGYNVIWKDIDFDENVITRRDFSLRTRNAGIPDSLAKTFVQIWHGEVKYITVTLHYKKKRSTGGTCLIQGNRCARWTKSEFHALCAMVRQLSEEEGDEENMAASDLHHLALADCTLDSWEESGSNPNDATVLGQSAVTPFPSLPPATTLHPPPSPCSGTPSPPVSSPTLRTDSTRTPTRPTGIVRQTEDTDTSVTSHAIGSGIKDAVPTHLDWSAEIANTDPPPVISYSSRGDSGVTVVASAEINGVKDLPTASPAEASGQLITSPSPTPPSNGLRDDVMPVSSGIPPEAVTTAASNNNGVDVRRSGPLVVQHVAAGHINLLMLRAHIAIGGLQEDLRAMKREMRDTKSQLATALDKIDQLDQHIRDNAVKAANEIKMSERCLTDKLAGLQEQLSATTETQLNIDCRINKLFSAKDSQGHVLRDLKKQVLDITPAAPPATVPAEYMPPTLPPPPQFLDKSCGDRIPVWVTAARDGGTTGTHADNATRTRPNDGLRDTSSRQPDQREPPADRLAQCSVKPDTTAVIIGDSILRDMQGNKMANTLGERVQIISVSGLTTVDLTEWLPQQKPAPHAETVTLHVGVNDCKISEVTSKQWEDLVTQCRRVFPRARLQASTIIPAKGRHALNQTILPSNSNLCHVCRKMGVTLINNTATFTAVSGAPCLALYRDHIHPSYKGMIRLAGNIKRAGRPDEDTAGHNPPRGDTDDRPAGTTKRATYSSVVDRQQPPAPAGTSYSSESRIPHSQAETRHLQQQQHQQHVFQEHTSPHLSPVSYPGQLQPSNGFYQPATPMWQNYLHGTPVSNTQNQFSAMPPFSVPAFHSWPHFHQFDHLSNPVRVF